MIAAIGTASKIPTNPMTNHHKIIEIKIIIGLIPKDLFIIIGERILFSTVLMTKTTPATTAHPRIQNPVIAPKTAGIPPTNGPK